MIKTNKQNFKILDTTLREGIQSIHPVHHQQGIVFSEKQSLRIAQLLIDFGIDYIEIGAPVRSQLSHKVIRKIVKMTRDTNTKVVIHTRCVKKDIEEVVDLGVDGINLFLNAEKHRRLTQEESVAILNEYLDFIDTLHAKHLIKRFSFEDSFRTPFRKINKAISTLILKADRLGVPDTTGMAEPAEVQRLFSHFRKNYPNLELECHFHNDLGLATANALAAVKAGVNVVDTTILGIGERNGIVPLSGLCAALSRNAVSKEYLSSKYNLKLLHKIDKTVADMLGIPIPLNMPITGPGYFSHVAGVHANDYVKNSSNYESLKADDFGRSTFVSWTSAVVGKSSMLVRAKELGVFMPVEAAQKIADQVRELAKSEGGISTNTVDQLILQTSKSPRNIHVR